MSAPNNEIRSVLVSEKAVKDFCAGATDKYKRAMTLSPDELTHRITFWGLLGVLIGNNKAGLLNAGEISFQPHTAEKFPHLRKGNDAELLYDWLRLCFFNTPIDPTVAQSGKKPLIATPTGKSDQNKLGLIRHGRFALYHKHRVNNTTGGNADWQKLRQAFLDSEDVAFQTLEQIVVNLQREVAPSCFASPQVQSVLEQIFCYVYDAAGNAPSAETCCRQLALLCTTCLLGEEPTARWSPWVCSGARPEDQKSDPLKEFFGRGLFSLPRKEINTQLIPDVHVMTKNCVRQPFRLTDMKTPLEQILDHYQTERFFLLYGDQETSVSGAGKTTSLRQLYYDLKKEEKNVWFVPLNQLYGAHAMGGERSAQTTSRLLFWLEGQGISRPGFDSLGSCVFLLDGMDEITAVDGVESLGRDLLEIEQRPELSVVLASKIEPEQYFRTSLKNYTALWSKFVRCCIQPLRLEQRTGFLEGLGTGGSFPPSPKGTRNSAVSPKLLEQLNTPFLLKLYLEYCGLLRGRESSVLSTRWLPRAGTIESVDGLFYRYLTAQICRWYDSNLGQDIQNECDAFFATYALPAIAWRLLLDDIYRDYSSNVPKAKNSVVGDILDQAFPAYKRSLLDYPAYGSGYIGYAGVLAGNEEHLDRRAFAAGQAAALLPQKLDKKELSLCSTFSSNAMRECFAVLHLANLIFCAYNGQLTPDEKTIAFFLCPLYFLPGTLLRRAAGMLDEITGERGWIYPRLLGGPEHLPGQSAFSRYLFSYLAAYLWPALEDTIKQRSDGTVSRRTWLAEASCAYHELAEDWNVLTRQYRTDHILTLASLARALRGEEQWEEAKVCAREAMQIYIDHPGVKNTDGFHSLAMSYLEQIRGYLNSGEPLPVPSPVPTKELAFAREICRDISRLCALAESGQALPENTVFGRVERENRPLVPHLAYLLERACLRLERYEKENFFGDDTVKFLLEGSFTAKAHSVYAALGESAGAAMNLLGAFLENDQEVLENHADLPFFRAHPDVHIPIPEEELTYPERYNAAFIVYDRIYHIRRGPQPYSARKAAQLILSRRVRLSENAGAELTEVEREYLDKATAHACDGYRPGYAIPRIQLLNENGDRGEMAEIEARELFRMEWDSFGCWKKIVSLKKDEIPLIDLYTAMLLSEYRPGWLEPVQWSDSRPVLPPAPEKIMELMRNFFLCNLELPVRYVIGSRLNREELLNLLDRFRRNRPENQFMTKRWLEIDTKLKK